MKQIIASRGFLATLVPTICLFTCLFLSMGALQAQNLQGPSTQQFNWMDVSEAEAVLNANIAQANQQLPGLTEGTSLYENTLRRVVYYKAILKELGQGTPIETALEKSLTEAATLGGAKEVAYTPKVVLRALFEEVKLQLTE